ncbi:hypothetical protein [Neobacillus mesonae]|uniref:hypothetical protein n=1 Tax=Neobacillus mesonae TaxID=1193713 RepID=UPI00203B1988|nr:hypothetical protein [Neobacillus mesonae]MCM3567304.1 hypothetical protein [Neobacillus mesonae]
MEHTFIFIGKRMKEKGWKVTSRPGFYDALQFTYPTQQKVNSAESSYQSIPLHSANITCGSSENTIYFTFHNGKLRIFTEKAELSDHDIYDIFSSLLLKEGNKVSYLIQPPKRKSSKINRKKIRTTFKAKTLARENYEA